jgi:hypothetical protein
MIYIITNNIGVIHWIHINAIIILKCNNKNIKQIIIKNILF